MRFPTDFVSNVATTRIKDLRSACPTDFLCSVHLNIAQVEASLWALDQVVGKMLKRLMVIPAIPVLRLLSDTAASGFEQIKLLHAPLQRIRAVRSLLLACLMSGKLTT